MDFGISIHLLSEYRKLMFPSMEPLTENDIPRFDSMDLDQMDLAKLEELEYQLEDLRSDMEYREPGSRGSEEYRLWSGRLAKVEAFLGQRPGSPGRNWGKRPARTHRRPCISVRFPSRSRSARTAVFRFFKLTSAVFIWYIDGNEQYKPDD